MLARLLGALGLATAAAATFAAAASVAVGSGGVGAGNAPVGRCDADGFTYTRSIDTAKKVTGATIGGIATACAGGTLNVTLANASGAAIAAGSVPLPSSGFTGTAAVPVSGLPLATDVSSYRVIVVGP